MREITTLPDARDMITATGLKLPDRLTGKPGYGNDRQSNILLAFQRIRSCLPLIEKKVGNSSLMQKLDRYLEQSQLAYEAGDRQKGRRYFMMFDATAFPENYEGVTIPSDWDW